LRPVEETGVDRALGIDGIALDLDRSLWRRHLYMGIASFVLGGGMFLVYIALTFHRPQRGLIMTLDIAAIVASLGIVGPVGTRLIATRWRDLFFFSWSVGTLAVIAIPLALDGGAGSPLASFLVLPVLFGGLLYRLHAVIGLACLALGCLGLLFLTGVPVSGTRAIPTAIMIGVAGAISVTASMNRNIWEQERKALTASLHRLATHDGLTGCLNYQAFQDAVIHEGTRAERYDRPLSVVIADLDGFKAVNDFYGHGVGDETLRGVAHAMHMGVRSTDLVGRIGGDEFAVLLPEAPTTEAKLIVERIQEQMRSMITPASVTLSFGVSTWQAEADSATELLQRADTALYEAKRSGRNRVVTWGAPTALNATEQGL